VAADADEDARQHRLGFLGKVDNLRDIGEIVAGESNQVRLPLRDQPVIGGVALDLQIDQADRMTGAAGGLRDQLHPQRLELQEYLGVEQRTRVNE
jgi:hypothetical protein